MVEFPRLLQARQGDFARIREVSKSSHDIIMGGSISSDDEAVMEVDSQAASLPQEDEPDDDGASQEAQQQLKLQELPGTSGLSPGTLFGAEVPSGLLAIEDAKPDGYYQASDQIQGAHGD